MCRSCGNHCRKSATGQIDAKHLDIRLSVISAVELDERGSLLAGSQGDDRGEAIEEHMDNHAGPNAASLPVEIAQAES